MRYPEAAQGCPGGFLLSLHLNPMTLSCLVLCPIQNILLWGYFYIHLISTVGIFQGRRRLLKPVCLLLWKEPCLDHGRGWI